MVALPKFDSDASKVQSKGMGLKKAYLARQNQFQIDAGRAGKSSSADVCKYIVQGPSVAMVHTKARPF